MNNYFDLKDDSTFEVLKRYTLILIKMAITTNKGSFIDLFKIISLVSNSKPLKAIAAFVYYWY